MNLARAFLWVDDPQARDYYIEETARQQWSSRVLERAIGTSAFQRLLQKPEPAVLAAPAPNPLHFLKDPYILEFLGLSEQPNPGERALEDALVTRLRDFLMELGKGFSFVGRQFRVSTETSHFCVDLNFFPFEKLVNAYKVLSGHEFNEV